MWENMKYLLGALILLNIADSLLTHFIVTVGANSEGNPFVMSLVGQPAFFAVKTVDVIICVVILRDISRRYKRLVLVASSSFVAAYSGIVM
jgi:hypothetical protein